MKHQKSIQQFLAKDDYVETPSGLLIHGSILAKGMYKHSVGGKDIRYDPNLIPSEGILHILNVAFGATAKTTTWYLALFAGAVDPAANWTAANFSATASEITSATEGYTNATRPEWVEDVAAAGAIGNLTTNAVFNIACTTSLNISGAAMLSSSTKGGTTGVLASASRFSIVRTVYNGEPFELEYSVTLTDS